MIKMIDNMIQTLDRSMDLMGDPLPTEFFALADARRSLIEAKVIIMERDADGFNDGIDLMVNALHIGVN